MIQTPMNAHYEVSNRRVGGRMEYPIHLYATHDNGHEFAWQCGLDGERNPYANADVHDLATTIWYLQNANALQNRRNMMRWNHLMQHHDLFEIYPLVDYEWCVQLALIMIKRTICSIKH